MNDKLLIGVDVGTQGVKGALYDLGGRLRASAYVPSRLHRPDADTVEEDPEFQVASACRVIAQCVRKARAGKSSVAGMAFDGQMAGVIGVGADGRAVTPYDSWLDTRCRPQIDRMLRKAGDEVLAKTGCAPSFNHGPKILRWKRQFPAIYRRIRAFVQPGAYVAMRLCGLDGSRAFVDTTYLHFSGFADNRRARWDDDLVRTFGIDGRKLPAIVRPSDIVGELAPDIARRCGLRAGVPVSAGCGDTVASFLACGAVREGVCVDVAGTASVFAATTSAFRPDRKGKVLACGQAATPGLWHPYAYINGGGMNLEWFRREIANRGRSGAGDLDFAALNRLAEAVGDGGELPIFVPHLGGRVCPPQPDLRGAWVGLTWCHGLGHLYRAALEGVALEYGIYQQVISELYPALKLNELRITGGGEKSSVWNSIKADVLQMPVVQVARGGGAPMGSAMLAGVGVGALKSLGEAAGTWVSAGKRTGPRPAMRTYYQARLRRYRQLLDLLRKEPS